jgi:hypothetical protein
LKVWRLSRPLQALALVMLAVAAYGAFAFWRAYEQATLVTVGGLGRFLVVTAVAAMLPRIVALIRYRTTLRTLGLKALVGSLLALAFKVHLRIFDPVFLKMGRFRQSG